MPNIQEDHTTRIDKIRTAHQKQMSGYPQTTIKQELAYRKHRKLGWQLHDQCAHCGVIVVKLSCGKGNGQIAMIYPNGKVERHNEK